MLQLVLGVIVALVVIGVLLFLINKMLGPYMQAQILQLLNIAVVVIVAICLVFYILSAFGLLPLTAGPPVPKLR
jgi:heme/copper-type cytochrome/quinol oxidase subunit 1